MPGVLQLFVVVVLSCLLAYAFSHASSPSPFSFYFLSFFASAAFFHSPLMYIFSLQILGHSCNLPVKFHLIWTWFGWGQKCLKFESNSNLEYFSSSKNVQTIFKIMCINLGAWGYFHISHTPLQSPCAFCSLFMFEEGEQQ